MNCSLIFFIIVYAEVVMLKETQKKCTLRGTNSWADVQV